MQYPSASAILCPCCDEVMASWERGRPARTKPGAASPISPTWINRERRHGSPTAWPHAVPAHRVAACSIALKLSKGTGCGRDARSRRDSMRAGRPRSQVGSSRWCAVGGIWRATSLDADLSPLGNSRLPASRAPAPGPGGSFEGETGFVSDKSRPRPAVRIIRE